MSKGLFSPQDEGRALLAAILESSEDAIIGKDLSGEIVLWSIGAERMFGYSSAEAVGQSIALLIPDESAETLVSTMQEVAAGRRVEPHDTVRLTKHRRRIEVSLTITPLRDASGMVIGALSVSRDTTRQRRVDHLLRRSEEQWRAIVESAVDGIIVIDRRGRIESFNAAAERLFGYDAREVRGLNVSILMPPSYATRHDHYLKRYLDTGERTIIGTGREVMGRRKDGSTFPMHLSVGEASIEGETKFTGIVRDLTDRIAMELKLHQESGLARLGELAAMLAHEVKNPLTAVSGAIQMIAGALPPNSEEQEIVQEILQRIDGLSRLMGDLLLYARPPQPNKMNLDVPELIRGLVTFFRSDPNWGRLAVALEGQAPLVDADPHLVRIALQNLLMNAGQAMQGEGTLVVRVDASDGMAHVDVVDSGPGMSPDVQTQVFTPFFTTKARGTGLGLATVKRIAESHGGTVTILRSTEDGTTMRLSLPLES